MNVDIPERLERKLYIQLLQYKWQSHPKITVSEYEIKVDSDTVIATTLAVYDLEVDLGRIEINVTGKIIEGLKKQKTTIQVTAEREINKIDEQIQSMLAIEYQPEVAA